MSLVSKGIPDGKINLVSEGMPDGKMSLASIGMPDGKMSLVSEGKMRQHCTLSIKTATHKTIVRPDMHTVWDLH